MAAQNNYAFDLFETHGSAAPARREERREPVPAQKPLRRVPSRSKKQIRLQRRVTAVRAFVIGLFAAAVLTMTCLQLSVGAKSYELKREIEKAEVLLQETKSENVRLNAALNGITTVDKICSYATDVLGMIKVESYQVDCIDLSDGDVILYAAGNSTQADSEK